MTTTCDGYRLLIQAILLRATDDAQGKCASPGSTSVDKLQADAQRWLQDTAAVSELLELAGYDSHLVLPRLRQCLYAHGLP